MSDRKINFADYAAQERKAAEMMRRLFGGVRTEPMASVVQDSVEVRYEQIFAWARSCAAVGLHLDVYRLCASQVTGRAYDLVTANQREAAKRACFYLEYC